MKNYNSKQNQKIRQSLDLLDDSFNHARGVVKLNKNNTFNHELMKFILCWEILQAGEDFVTEAIFKNGKRSDVFNLVQGEALEVTYSEDLKSIDDKKTEYPVPVFSFDSKKMSKWLKNYVR